MFYIDLFREKLEYLFETKRPRALTFINIASASGTYTKFGQIMGLWPRMAPPQGQIVRLNIS